MRNASLCQVLIPIRVIQVPRASLCLGEITGVVGLFFGLEIGHTLSDIITVNNEKEVVDK